MAKFDFSNTGYEKNQVDEFIDNLTLKYEEKLSEQKDRVFSLKNEVSVLNERLSLYEKKDKQMTSALITAVEKAEQIENSAKKIYDLEIRRIRILYGEWKKTLDKIQISGLEDNEVQNLLKELEKNLTDIIKQNQSLDGNESIKENIKRNSDIFIKNLLNKMEYAIPSNKENREVFVEKKVVEEKNTNDKKDIVTKEMDNQFKENSRLLNIQRRFQNITGKIGKGGNGNFVDKFLNDNSTVPENNAYVKQIARKNKNRIEPNETGFDYEDALNPKEELNEIMKAFDFFNSENLGDK